MNSGSLTALLNTACNCRQHQGDGSGHWQHDRLLALCNGDSMLLMSSCRNHICFPSLLTNLVLLSFASSSFAEIPRHPVVLPENVAPSKCLECHNDKAKGKFVHTAISMGCTVCHSVANVKGATYITLSSPSNQLCVSCHTLSTDPVGHLPYKEGNCVACHSPHASDFPAQLHASPQDVCMACHVRGRMKVNRESHTLTLPWGTVIPFKEMDSWTYLNLDKTSSFNHPVEGHPVSGPNSSLGNDAPPITCLSCHEPHHSTQSNLIRPKYRSVSSLCESCHHFPS
jgi:predicted CXXCH cytochrome family protein